LRCSVIFSDNYYYKCSPDYDSENFSKFAWLTDPWRTPYPQSGHMSTIDQA